MPAYTILRTALRSLRRNVLRSLLTCVGIIIGIAAVIAMTEIGQGTSQAVQQSIASMGASVIQLDPSAAAIGGVSSGAGGKASMTPADCDAIRTECDAVRWAAPSVDCHMQVVYGNRNWFPNNILGTTPDYFLVRNWTDLASGELFGEEDVRASAAVCVVGQTVVRELFDGESPLGRQIRVGGVRLKVVGVLTPKGANPMGRDQDDFVIAPWTTVKFRISGARQAPGAGGAPAGGTSGASSGSAQVNSLSQLYPARQMTLYPQRSAVQGVNTPQMVRFTDVDDIFVSAASRDDIPQAISQITALLRERHHLPPGAPDDFRIRDLTEISDAVASTTRVLTNLLLCVALISLVVGGVGIMNIMLVSVTERTREIGLRMAVGARSRDILRQFLAEAVVLCLAGGVVGIGVGRGASVAITALFRWPTLPSASAVVGATLVSAVVGIAFGFYPAWKASRLDPIDALRYE